MAESTSLLADVGEDATRISDSDDKHLPATHYFKRPIRILTIFTLILSALSIAILIANYYVARNAPIPYTWRTERATSSHIPIMVASLIFSLINIFTHFPILLNMIVDPVLAAFFIAKVVGFIGAFPDSSWCSVWIRYPNRETIYPGPRCRSFRLAMTIMMGFVAGFSIIIAAIYLIQLLLRSIAVCKAKLWRRPLSWTLPTGEITFQVSLKILKQEPAGRGAEGGAGGAHGPVYLS